MYTTKNKLHFAKNTDHGIGINSKKSDKYRENITSNAIDCTPNFLATMEKQTVNDHYPHIADENYLKISVNNLKIKKNRADIDEKESIRHRLKDKLFVKGWRGIIGRRLKERRLDHKISQMDLGLMLGWDQEYISRIEAGKVNICLDNLTKIATVLDCFIQLEVRKHAERSDSESLYIKNVNMYFK